MNEKKDAVVVAEPAETPAPIAPSNVTAIAAAEAAKAMVQGRILMALQRPRDLDQARLRILADCKRYRFAEQARYAKPMGGGKVRGWSIRFAEAAVRHLGNIDVQANTIAEDDDKMLLRFQALDLETNSSFGGEMVITKTVERSRLRPGEVAIRTRTNSKGKATYIVPANEDDLQTKIGNHISKGIRTYALRHVPADILEDALDQCDHTLRQGDADPKAAVKRIVDSYAQLGIGPEDVKKLAGVKELDLITPPKLEHLREVYVALREGDVDFDDLFDEEGKANKSLKDKLAKKDA
jgi:hypothetical protein